MAWVTVMPALLRLAGLHPQAALATLLARRLAHGAGRLARGALLAAHG